jgi:hypothetical protein
MGKIYLSCFEIENVFLNLKTETKIIKAIEIFEKKKSGKK